ncbi:MAG TPA: hypothetical protein VH136_18670 [Trebonia sp.]|jgi:hypothetical protein|nr:hypothetical protein [Trebonia sp.]
MTENTTTTEAETATAETAAPEAPTDLDAARAARRPSSRERARADSAAKQAAASGASAKPAPTAAALAKEAAAKVSAAIGEEPHTATLRTRFEALGVGKRKAAVKAARLALEGGATRAAAWNAAMDEVAPKEAAAPKAPAKPKAEQKFRGVAIPGYVLKWPHGGYDLLATTDKSADRPVWLVRCNAHGTTKPIKAAKEGDVLGTNAGRPAWCAKCKAEA